MPDPASKEFSRKRASSPEEKRMQAFEINNAAMRGLTTSQIARFVGLKPKRVKDILNESKLIDKYEFDQQTHQYIAKKFWLSCQHRVAKLWELFNNPYNDAHVKVKCVAAVHVIEKDMIAMGQSLGLIGKYDSDGPAVFNPNVNTDRLLSLAKSLDELGATLAEDGGSSSS